MAKRARSAPKAGEAKALKASLKEQLQAVSGVQRAPRAAATAPTVVTDRGRKGMKSIAIYMQPIAKKQLDDIAHAHGKSIQALGIEALNLLFRHYDLKPIA